MKKVLITTIALTAILGAVRAKKIKNKDLVIDNQAFAKNLNIINHRGLVERELFFR